MENEAEIRTAATLFTERFLVKVMPPEKARKLVDDVVTRVVDTVDRMNPEGLTASAPPPMAVCPTCGHVMGAEVPAHVHDWRVDPGSSNGELVIVCIDNRCMQRRQVRPPRPERPQQEWAKWTGAVPG